MNNPNNRAPKKVFISYSWSSEEKVCEIVERLMYSGIDVVFDKYDLKEGQDKYVFMEKSVNDDTVDRVLIFCDKVYADKANNRTGGVGDETIIISPEIYSNVKQNKFIPIILEHEDNGEPCCPSYIKSRIYIDLSNDDNFEASFEKLIRNIYDMPLYKKPPLGNRPEWLGDDDVTLSEIKSIVKQLKDNNGKNSRKEEYLVKKAKESFIDAALKYGNLHRKDPEEMLTIIEQTKPYRDLFVDYCELIICSDLPSSVIIADFFENIYNQTRYSSTNGFYQDTDDDMSNFIIWELFICATAVLLNYEKYKELNSLLTHTYFLKQRFISDNLIPSTYGAFRNYNRTIEDIIKPQTEYKNYHSLTAEITIKREWKHLITKDTIVNADLVLYQLGVLLNTDLTGSREWFPSTYLYKDNRQEIWIRLSSKEYCMRISPLFGCETIDELKAVIKKAHFSSDFTYPRAFRCAPGITASIEIDDIGKYN